MHSQVFQKFKMENEIGWQQLINRTGPNPIDDQQICASVNFIRPPKQLHYSTGASPINGEQVCASTSSDSTNLQMVNRNDAIEEISRELLLSVIETLTKKQQEFQNSESALLSRIKFLENELKDTHLKHVICAKKLAKAQRELEVAESKINQKDHALIELRGECNALNTSVHRSNEAVEVAFSECGELHNTQAQSYKERDDALQEMQRMKSDYNEKLSKMKATMNTCEQKMTEVMKLIQQEASSMDQLDFDEFF